MDLREEFIKYIQFEKRYSEHTVVAYNTDQVRSWIIYLMEQGISSRSINRKIATLKSFYKFLMRQEIIDSNPVQLLTTPKVGKKLPTFVQKENLDHLLDWDFFDHDFEGSRDKLIISLLYGTGVRLSELKNLKVRNVDPKEHTIKVLGKRNKERIMPF